MHWKVVQNVHHTVTFIAKDCFEAIPEGCILGSTSKCSCIPFGSSEDLGGFAVDTRSNQIGASTVVTTPSTRLEGEIVAQLLGGFYPEVQRLSAVHGAVVPAMMAAAQRCSVNVCTSTTAIFGQPHDVRGWRSEDVHRATLSGPLVRAISGQSGGTLMPIQCSDHFRDASQMTSPSGLLAK